MTSLRFNCIVFSAWNKNRIDLIKVIRFTSMVNRIQRFLFQTLRSRFSLVLNSLKLKRSYPNNICLFEFNCLLNSYITTYIIFIYKSCNYLTHDAHCPLTFQIRWSRGRRCCCCPGSPASLPTTWWSWSASSERLSDFSSPSSRRTAARRRSSSSGSSTCRSTRSARRSCGSSGTFFCSKSDFCPSSSRQVWTKLCPLDKNDWNIEI